MPVGLLLFVILFIPAVLSMTAANIYYEIILRDLRRRLPQGLGVKYPRLSWNYYKMIDLHKQYYPKSRVPVTLKFFVLLGFGLTASLALIGTIFAFSNPVAR